MALNGLKKVGWTSLNFSKFVCGNQEDLKDFMNKTVIMKLKNSHKRHLLKIMKGLK